MDLKNIVGDYLIESGQNIKNNTCGLSEEEIAQLASSIIHKELNKTEAAELLNISTRTFDRKVANGELPQGVSVRGQNTKIWYEDELLK